MAESKNDSLDIIFFKKLLGSSLLGISIYDSDLNCVYFNEKSTEMFEFDPKDTRGKNLLEIVPGIEKTDRYKKYCETLETGKTNKAYFCKKSPKDPNISICLDVTIQKIEDKLVVFFEDVTKERNSLHQQDSRLISLLDNLTVQIFYKDTDYLYTEVNKACASFHELTKDEIIGKSDYDVFTPEVADKIRQEDERVIKKGITFENVDRPLMNKHENTIWVSTTKVPLKDLNGNVNGLLGISFDITDRKMVESEVELLIATMHQTSETIIITDRDDIIQYVNPSFEEISGYSIAEAVGEKPSILQSGKHDKKFYEKLWDTISNGESWRGHFINKKKDGTLYEEDATISPVRNQNGEITNYVAVKKDVTNEKKLEGELMQSQKMEAIGRLAGGIAHDFNNILTAILGYSDLLLMGMDDSDPKKAKIQEIKKAGKVASSLTKQMLAFSKKQVIERKSLDINITINEMLSMLRRIIGENIKLEIELDDKIDKILSDHSQIEQILMNLAVNAKDAMPEKGGILKVKTENTYLNKDYSDGNFEASPGAYVNIIVEDNGCGIGEETLDHIFEPFFSHKKANAGTGLGLSTVYGIVKQHEGFIEVESNLGKGAVFSIFLPSDPEPDNNPTEEHLKETVFEESHGNVLVVEDEPPILALAASILEMKGCNVTTALTAEEALEIYDSNEEPFDLLITDVILPGMTGNELGEEITKKQPDIQILFMSGYLGDSLKGLDIASEEVNFIAKPFTMEGFAKKVMGIMGPKKS